MNKNHLHIIFITTIIIAGLYTSKDLISEKKVDIKNLNQTKKQVVLTKTIEYETIKIYNNNLSKGTVVTKEEGHNGLVYVNEKGEELQLIESPKNAKIEIGTGEETNYIGKMTGYGADCKGCSGYGTLACKTKDGKSFSLASEGEYYTDEQYGNVRILAASLDKFPCGTVIKVENSNLGTFNAIVLDTGSAMRNAWSKGIVHMDLAFKTENDPKVHLATSSNTKYSVQRWGY